ncbi:MAG: ABC transporter ATP-binding protein [bacterium]|nr:ABC transporter ATP-binding protein [bacterium]
MMIEINHLYKSYGQQVVLDDINFSIQKGVITGLLGPNGAGKTTLVSILIGIIPRDKGEISIDGLDLDNHLPEIQAVCSIVPQNLAIYPMLSAYENLEYFGGLQGLKGQKLKSRIDYCTEVASLQSFLTKRVHKFSGGMKRRLNLAIGLLNTPRMLYLDEPTVGVDTQSRNYILEMIQNINRKEGTTIIYTSHYMEEIEQVSDMIAIIDEGHLILNGSKDKILKQDYKVSIRVCELNDALLDRFKRIKAARVQDDCILLTKDENFHDNLIDILSVLKNHAVEVIDFDSRDKNLETLFLKLTRRSLRDE